MFLLVITLFLSGTSYADEGGMVESGKASDSGAAAYIKITDAKFKKSLIALPALQFQGIAAKTPGHLKFSKEFLDVLKSDLEISGYFELQKPESFLEDPNKVGLQPKGNDDDKALPGFDFSTWKQIKTEFLVRIGYRIDGDTLVVDTYTYYVPQAKSIFSKTYKVKSTETRAAAHVYANDLLKELTGKKGMFQSRFVVSRSTKPNQKEIFIMDWDGFNAKQITYHKTISTSPAWSFDGRTVAYSSFSFHANEKKRNLDMYTFDTVTGRRFLISYRKGINSGAAFFPSGRHLLLTLSNLGNPDIYKMSIDGKNLDRLTNGPKSAMNVEPAMSPDGGKIAFSSDRAGRPHIFVMNADGSNIKQITIAGEYNSAPHWSPDGKRLAFAALDKTHFDIFTVNSDGTDMIRVTSAKKANGKFADNEDPSYSPDGRHLLYLSNRTGANQLYVSTVDGEIERRITYDQFQYFKPYWSPSFD